MTTTAASTGNSINYFAQDGVWEEAVSTTFQGTTANTSPMFSDMSSIQQSPASAMFPSLQSSNTSATPSLRPAPTPRSTSDQNTRGSPSSSDSREGVSSGRVAKRQRNTEAARRYRQRKVDRVTELEEALAAMTKERDELRLKLARSQAEADVLRGMVGK